MDELGKMREVELLNAAKALGIREVEFLNYIDGDLDQADPAEATARIVEHIKRVRPDVVITFDPNGAYGHPDHIAICQFTTAAVLAAADPDYSNTYAPHRVSKLYYMAWPKGKFDAYESVFGKLTMKVDNNTRVTTPWPDWAVTSVVDTADHWNTVWQAVSSHKTQLVAYSQLEHLSPEHHKALWGTQEYYRALSLVNGGRTRETDLFEGLR